MVERNHKAGQNPPRDVASPEEEEEADYLLGLGPRLIKKEFTGPRSQKG
jgi:hypothetical protein